MKSRAKPDLVESTFVSRVIAGSCAMQMGAIPEQCRSHLPIYVSDNMSDNVLDFFSGRRRRADDTALGKLIDQIEYLLMTPFTPQKRNNMISWLAARCDFPEYGKMLFYELPKEKLIYGPMQIEAMINQNTAIAAQLTLWDQKGSRVIRGNLIAVPIENSFLYVVPLYLTAEGTDFPQLKRVIVISGDKVVMETTLDEAIQSVFGTQSPQNAAQAPRARPGLGQARAQFDEAQKAIQQGDWGNFGKAMDALKRLLNGPTQ